MQASLTGGSSEGAHGSLRWQAPELLCPKTFGGSGKHTFASDIYAFGMTCLEVSRLTISFKMRTSFSHAYAFPHSYP